MQLFSSPQQRVAPRTKSEPVEKLNNPCCREDIFSKERIMLASVIKIIEIKSLKLTLSLKMARAIIVVATISKLPSREALEEDPVFTPCINKIGAAISRIIMAIVYGRSAFERLFDLSLFFI